MRSIEIPSNREACDRALADARHAERSGLGSSEDVRYRLMSRGALANDPSALLSRVQAGQVDSIDEAVAWLRLDPFCLWSGYLKRDLMRALTGQKLSTRQAEAIRTVLLEILPRGPRQEFRCSCRLARAVNNEAFREQLANIIHAADAGTVERARWMLDGCVRTTST